MADRKEQLHSEISTTMKKITQYLLTVSIVLIASCQHKELCYDHYHKANVVIGYNWDNTLENYPKSMSLYLYPEDTSAYIRYEFTGHQGGALKIPYGTYSLLSINSDFKMIEYKNKDSLNLFELCAKTAVYLPGTNITASNLPKVKGSQVERFVESIDSLWSDRYSGPVLIKQLWTDTTQVDTLNFTPKLINRQINVSITEAENLKFATGGVSFSISGLAGGYLPYRDTLTSEAVTVLAPLAVGKDGLSVSGSLSTFGDNHKSGATHTLTAYAILSDGSKWYHTFDVTEEIHKGLESGNVTIELKGLPIPAPLFNGGGITPDVDDWQNVEIPVVM